MCAAAKASAMGGDLTISPSAFKRKVLVWFILSFSGCVVIFVRFSKILLPGSAMGGTPRIHQNVFKWMVLVWFWDIFVFWPSGVAWLA